MGARVKKTKTGLGEMSFQINPPTVVAIGIRTPRISRLRQTVQRLPLRLGCWFGTIWRLPSPGSPNATSWACPSSCPALYCSMGRFNARFPKLSENPEMEAGPNNTTLCQVEINIEL